MRGRAGVLEHQGLEQALVEREELARRQALGHHHRGLGQDQLGRAQARAVHALQQLEADVLDVDRTLAHVGALGLAHACGEVGRGLGHGLHARAPGVDRRADLLLHAHVAQDREVRAQDALLHRRGPTSQARFERRAHGRVRAAGLLALLVGRERRHLEQFARHLRSADQHHPASADSRADDGACVPATAGVMQSARQRGSARGRFGRQRLVADRQLVVEEAAQGPGGTLRVRAGDAQATGVAALHAQRDHLEHAAGVGRGSAAPVLERDLGLETRGDLGQRAGRPRVQPVRQRTLEFELRHASARARPWGS